MAKEDNLSCFICLEDTNDPKPSLVNCACKFRCHTACWQNYVATKGRCECPMCHYVFMPNMSVQVNIVLPSDVEENGIRNTQRHCTLQRVCQGFFGLLMLFMLILLIWEWAA